MIRIKHELHPFGKKEEINKIRSGDKAADYYWNILFEI